MDILGCYFHRNVLTTLPSGHVNFSSSGRVGLVPGLQDVLEETSETIIIICSVVKLHAEVDIEHYREMKIAIQGL